MTAAQLQETFKISRADWRRIAADPGMPEPLDPKYTEGVTRWYGSRIAHWLAARYPDLAHSTPRLLRPAGNVATQYDGGEYTEYGPGGAHEHFTGYWRTGYGRVAIVYPVHQNLRPAHALEQHPSATTAVVMRSDWNIYGLPNLDAADRARPDLEYEPSWSELSAHIGTPVPWWPTELLRADHLTAWRPAHEPVPVEVATWPNWEPLYDMAFAEAKHHPVRIACFSIGHEMRSRALEHANWEITHMNELAEPASDDAYATRQALERACMAIPAYPDTSDPGRAEATDDDEQIREGVAELCRRTDDLAVECLHHTTLWTNRYMPFGGAFALTETDATDAGREWIGRLKKVKPTAIHRLRETDTRPIDDNLVDPVTAIPAITKRGHYMFSPADEISYHSYAPRRLPAGSRLTEVIIDNPIWVRTQDGTLYPAPVMDAPGISWGYPGTGPGTLSVLIGRLLDDGSAHAVTYHDGDYTNGEPKLEAFFQLKHQPGTRLPRRLLENVRENGPDKLGLFDRIRYTRPRNP